MEEWLEMHEKLKEVIKQQIGVKKDWQKVVVLAKAWRKTSKESFFSATVNRIVPSTGDQIFVNPFCQFGEWTASDV